MCPSIWDATTDLPSNHGTPASDDIPCNVMAMPKIRHGRLEWMEVARSNDLFLGVPHNVVQFTSLQEILSGWLGLMPGAYVQLSDSLHAYERDVDAIRLSLEESTAPPNTDTFALDRLTWKTFCPT